MGLLRITDRVAGGISALGTTLGQVALVVLGVHLAADRIDDLLARALQEASLALGAPGLGSLPVPMVAAWGALLVELAAVALLSGAFLLTARQPALDRGVLDRVRSVNAVVMPVALAGVLIAGSWSMAMAAEDLLPPSPLAPWAAGLLGLAVLVRYGLPAWCRAVAALPSSPRWQQGLSAAGVLVPVGALAWMHGVPMWGWL